MNNLIGNPLDTTIGAACLYFGGVLDRHPKLTVVLAHGGGFTPYQAARWEHGWQVRPEPKKNISKQPTNIAKRFYYDTILHSAPVLEFMIGHVGADRVMLGSDYPYDMGMMDCVKTRAVIEDFRCRQGDNSWARVPKLCYRGNHERSDRQSPHAFQQLPLRA